LNHVAGNPTADADRGAARRTPPTIAFGPETPGWGSWEWVGADLIGALAGPFCTRSFAGWEVPDCDAVVVVKHAPPPGWAEQVTRRSVLFYAPIDYYAAAADIDADAFWLRRCHRVLVHCERLRRYFEPYAPVEYLDHHVKFLAPLRQEFQTKGDLLWVGVRSNLPPLVAWVNAHALPAPLHVLTNFEDPTRPLTPTDLGCRSDRHVIVHDWSRQRQVEMTAAARGVIDVKGDDFRSRHKPPAKGIDFLASGVPLAIVPGSSTAEHLARMGFEAASPLESDRWLSHEYWEETRDFGGALRELLAPSRIARRLGRIVREVLAEGNILEGGLRAT
jgi:hypothetical protein